MTSYTRGIKQDYTERMCRHCVGGERGVEMAFYFYKSQLTRKNSKSLAQTVFSEYNFAVEVLVIIPQ